MKLIITFLANSLRVFAITIPVIALLSTSAFAFDVFPGDTVRLKATNPAGVPVHQRAISSLIGRVADDSVVEVVDTEHSGRWLEIEAVEFNDPVWITKRYVDIVVSRSGGGSGGPVVTPTPSPTPPIQDTDGVLFPGEIGPSLLLSIQSKYTPENTLSYKAARDFMYTDLDNEGGMVEGIYSGFKVPVDPNSANPRADAIQNNRGINAEHTWPQSKGATGKAKSDMHHLFPAQVQVNGARSSKPFAEIPDNNTDQWLINNDVSASIPTSNIDGYSESTSDAFEPREAVKGNVARAIFYFKSIYDDQAQAGFFESQKDALCSWNRLDPVDAAELARSEGIKSKQGNENPFILDPTLADRLYCSQ